MTGDQPVSDAVAEEGVCWTMNSAKIASQIHFFMLVELMVNFVS